MTSATAHQETIAVAALRVGMFVHLDGGWMSHPFATSNFMIASAEQLAMLQSLGVARVRWSPELSELREPGPQPTPAETPPPAEPDGAEFGPVERRQQIVRQRQALAVCEQQFAEATSATARIFEQVGHAPIEARQSAEMLSSALTRKLIDAGEVCIRLLTESAGSRVSAHAVNVSVLSLLLGRAMGLGEADLQDVGVGALLHDIGKLDLPTAARHDDTQLNPADRELYRSHVALGVRQARKMGLSNGAALVLAQHHERHDGTGFPLRLGGERLTLPARVVALVNRYDNLCNPNWPSRAITPHEAMARLFAYEKAAFEPALLAAFIRLVGVYPPGSLVQLSDDRYAIVVSANPDRPLKPRLLVHEPQRAAGDGLFTDLERVPRLTIRRSLKAQSLPGAARDDLAPRLRIGYFWEPAAPLQ